MFKYARPMSYIAQAQTQEVVPTEYMTAIVDSEEYSSFVRSMLNYGAVRVLRETENDAPKIVLDVILNTDSEIDEIKSYIDGLVKERKASVVPITPRREKIIRANLKRAAIDDMMAARKILDADNISRQQAAAIERIVSLARKSTRVLMRSIKRATAEEKKAFAKTHDEMAAELKKLEIQLQNKNNRGRHELQEILRNIDYSDKNSAIMQLARAEILMNAMREDGSLGEYWERTYYNRIIDVKRKLNIPEESLREEVRSAMNADLVYYLYKFVHGDQKTEDQVAQEYGMLMQTLDAQRRHMDSETYEKIREAGKKAMETKIALLKAETETPELFVETGTAAEGGGEISAAGAANEYEFKVKLPLGKVVTISDMEKFKVVGRKSKRDAAAEIERNIKRSVIAAAEPALFKLLGYEPTGMEAGAISAYDPLRQYVGQVMQTASKNTLGLLGLVLGKSVTDLGEGAGKFLRYEMVQDPMSVNPALAELESWIRNKFDVFKIVGQRQPKGGPDAADIAFAKAHRSLANNWGSRKEPVARRKMYEDAAPAMAATPDGDGMNVPGMIGGAGEPVAPTPEHDGSGDNFQPRKKKRDDDKTNDK